ncbi:MAG: protoporphyrinogen oxidase [Bryobacteraceae bacterium]|nr:MAG: protoporphyrinogen oxidase [Bryobacteraceae bacterium]
MAATAIIGGGITGLAAAYELTKAGAEIVLVEAEPRLGGVIQTEVVEGCVLEGGPDSFLAAKPAAEELIRELGLGNELISSLDEQRVTYVVRSGRLVPLPDGLMMMVPTRVLPLALSPLLGWGTKLRMGLEYFRRPRPAARDRSVAEFIADHYGQEAVDYLAEPLLAGVYGGSPDRLSVESVLTRFAELERRYGSLTRGVLAARRAARARGGQTAPLFRTLKNGLAQLTEELEKRIRPRARIVHARALAVEACEGGYRVVLDGGEIQAPGVILACPAWAAGALVRGLDARLAELLEGIEYTSSVTLALGYRREDCGCIPPGFGFLVPARERRALVACTFVGAKFPYRVPETHAVLRCFLGGAGGETVLEQNDADLIRQVRAELKELLGWDADPRFTRLRRWRRAMAQYGVGHAHRVDEIRARLRAQPGLELAGNAYEGIGVPDCIRTGRAAARALLAPSSAGGRRS